MGEIIPEEVKERRASILEYIRAEGGAPRRGINRHWPEVHFHQIREDLKALEGAGLVRRMRIPDTNQWRYVTTPKAGDGK